MTKKEIVNRNIGLTFDFVREIIKDTSLIKSVPHNCEIEFVEKDFPVKNETALINKHIIKVKSVFEAVNKVAEPEVKYEKRK